MGFFATHSQCNEDSDQIVCICKLIKVFIETLLLYVFWQQLCIVFWQQLCILVFCFCFSPDETTVPMKDFLELKDEVKRIKKRIRDLEKQDNMGKSSLVPCLPSTPMSSPSSPSQPLISTPPSSLPPLAIMCPPPASIPSTPPAEEKTYNGFKIEALRDAIAHKDGLYESIHTLMTKLFSVEYILTHSVTGQKPNSAKAPKPKFDSRLYSAMVNLIKEKMPCIRDTEITQKVQSVQKKYGLKWLKNQNLM